MSTDLPHLFEPGDKSRAGGYAEFGSGDPEHDTGLHPNRQAARAFDILQCGMSVDGYAYARTVLGKELTEMLGDLGQRCFADAVPTASFVELRLWPFFTQRAWSYSAGSVSDQDEALHALNAAIGDARDREAPVR